MGQVFQTERDKDRLFINPNSKITLTAKNLTKSYRDYLQNTPHVMLRNCPSLSIATEKLTCLNNSRGVQLGILA